MLSFSAPGFSNSRRGLVCRTGHRHSPKLGSPSKGPNDCRRGPETGAGCGSLTSLPKVGGEWELHLGARLGVVRALPPPQVPRVLQDVAVAEVPGAPRDPSLTPRPPARGPRDVGAGRLRGGACGFGGAVGRPRDVGAGRLRGGGRGTSWDTPSPLLLLLLQGLRGSRHEGQSFSPAPG